MSLGFTEQSDVPKYRKKKKSGKSLASRRSDHKHEYQRVILDIGLGAYHWGGCCTICGRIDDSCGSFAEREEFMHPDEFKRGGLPYRRFLSVPELEEKFPGVPIFKWDLTGCKGSYYKQVGGFDE